MVQRKSKKSGVKLIPQKTKRVFVGMSGGVDSSVAAYLLKKQGYDVIGVYMRCWSGNGPDATVGADCTAEADATDARRVAEQLGIPFYVWDFEKEYKQKVVEYMIAGYRRGETPNPDVMCNREIKFGLFLARALKLGADYVATGHYVRSKVKSEKSKAKTEIQLFTARDTNKDQSYFLWTLTQEQLRHCLFPIGDYTKPQVRVIARRAKLFTADKKDSQGICFLGQVDVEDFLKTRLPERLGRVVTTTGQKVGEHNGAWFYTIGQRKGLDLGRKNKELRIKGKTDTKAHYVTKKNVRTNIVTVAEGPDHPDLFQKEVTLRDVHFISPLPAVASAKEGHLLFTIHYSLFTIPVFARIRYRQLLAKAKLILTPPSLPCQGRKEGSSRLRKSAFSPRLPRGRIATLRGWSALLVFEQSQRFVAPGQSAVFYSKKGEMLGGGIIGHI